MESASRISRLRLLNRGDHYEWKHSLQSNYKHGLFKRNSMIQFKKIFVAFVILSLFGCSKLPEGFQKIKADPTAREYTYSNGKLTYLEGMFPRKSYFVRYDLSKKSKWKNRLPDTTLMGNLQLIENDLVLVDSAYVANGKFDKALILADMKAGKIISRIPSPANMVNVIFYKPQNNSSKSYILAASSTKLILKTFNLVNKKMEPPVVIGAHSLIDDESGDLNGTYLFLEKRPLLIANFIEDSKSEMIGFDINEKKITFEFELPGELISLKEGDFENVLGLYQSEGEPVAEILRINLETHTSTVLARIEGEAEEMLLVNDKIYVISRDLAKATSTKKYWLSARNLTVVDRQNGNVVKTFPWTERRGDLFHYDPVENMLYFRVLDMDDPAFWKISNEENILNQVKQVIK